MRRFGITKNLLFDMQILAQGTHGRICFAEIFLGDLRCSKCSNFDQIEQVLGVHAAPLLRLPGLAVSSALHQVKPVLLDWTERNVLRGL